MSFRDATVSSGHTESSEVQLQLVTEISLLNQSNEMERKSVKERNRSLKEKDTKLERRIKEKRIRASLSNDESLTPPQMIMTPRHANTQSTRDHNVSLAFGRSPPDDFVTEKRDLDDRYDALESREEPPPHRGTEEIRATPGILSSGICPSCAQPLIQNSITTTADISSANVILCNSNSSIESSIIVDGGSSYRQNATGLSSFADDESSLRTYHEYATKKLEADVEHLTGSAQPIIERKSTCFGNGLGCSMMLPLNCLYNGLIGSYCDTIKAENQDTAWQENENERIDLDSLNKRENKKLPPYCKTCEAYIVFDSGDDREREQLLQDLANWLARSYSQESSESSTTSQYKTERPQRASIMVAASYPPPDSNPDSYDDNDANYVTEVLQTEDEAWADEQDVAQVLVHPEELSHLSGSIGSHDFGARVTDPEEGQATLSDQLNDIRIRESFPDENSQFLSNIRGEQRSTYHQHKGEPNVLNPDQYRSNRSLSVLTVQQDPPEVHTAKKALDPEDVPKKDINDAQDSDHKIMAGELPQVESAESISTLKEEQALIGDYQEKRRVATKAIGKMLMEGYLLTQVQCNLCEMPLMAKNGNSICVVCPLVARKAKKRASQKRTEQFPNQALQSPESNEPKSNSEKQDRDETKADGKHPMSYRMIESTGNQDLSKKNPEKILADINKFSVTNEGINISTSVDQAYMVENTHESHGASEMASSRCQPTDIKSSDEIYEIDVDRGELENPEQENSEQHQRADPTFLSEEVYRRLLNGWLLTDSNCSDCCGPLMQSPNNETQCIFCDHEQNTPNGSPERTSHIENVSGITERLMRDLSLSGTEGTGTDEAYSQPPSQQFEVESSLSVPTSVPTSEGYKYFVVPEDLDLDDDEALLAFLKQNRRNDKSYPYQNEREEAPQYSSRHYQGSTSYDQTRQSSFDEHGKQNDGEHGFSESQNFEQHSNMIKDEDYFLSNGPPFAKGVESKDHQEEHLPDHVNSHPRHLTENQGDYTSELKIYDNSIQSERRVFPTRGDAPEHGHRPKPDPPSVNKWGIDSSLRHSDQMHFSRSGESNDDKPEPVFSRSSENEGVHAEDVNPDARNHSPNHDEADSYDKAVNSDIRNQSSDHDNELLLHFDEPEEIDDFRHDHMADRHEGHLQIRSQTTQEIVSEYSHNNLSAPPQGSSRVSYRPPPLQVYSCRVCGEHLGEMHSSSESFMCHNTNCTLFGIPTKTHSSFSTEDPTVDSTVSPLGDEDTYERHIMNLESQLERPIHKDERWEMSSARSSGSDASIKMVASDTMDAIKEKMKNTSTKLLSNQDFSNTYEEDMDLAMLMQRLASAGRAIKELEHTVNEGESGYPAKRYNRGRPPKSPSPGVSPRRTRVSDD